MHLKNKGNIILLTMIFSSIITSILLLFCTMSINIMKYNNVNIHTEDLYSIDEYEEEIINICSNSINEYGIDNIKNSNEMYSISNGKYICSYNKENDYFKMDFFENNRSRILNYKIDDNKVILIPSYKYKKEVKDEK